MTHSTSSVLERLNLWNVLLGSAFVVAAWFAGQSGWIGTGPAERIAKLEELQATASRERAAQATAVRELRSDISFAIELLCLQHAEDTDRSTGASYLRSRCAEVTDRLGRP